MAINNIYKNLGLPLDVATFALWFFVWKVCMFTNDYWRLINLSKNMCICACVYVQYILYPYIRNRAFCCQSGIFWNITLIYTNLIFFSWTVSDQNRPKAQRLGLVKTLLILEMLQRVQIRAEVLILMTSGRTWDSLSPDTWRQFTHWHLGDLDMIFWLMSWTFYINGTRTYWHLI